VAGCAGLGQRAERHEAARWVGLGGQRLDLAQRREARGARRLAAGRERAGQDPRRRPAPQSHDEAAVDVQLGDRLVPGDPRPRRELVGDAARRGRHLELATHRHALERSVHERLEPAAELERAGVDAVRLHRR
jgi:hypothetical protein